MQIRKDFINQFFCPINTDNSSSFLQKNTKKNDAMFAKNVFKKILKKTPKETRKLRKGSGQSW